MEFAPALPTIAQTIQASLSPVFLLAGIGAILNVLAGRLARVVDRSRALLRLHPESVGATRARHVSELRLLDRRMSIINLALFLCTTSAMLVCVVIALLFVADLAKLHIGTYVALLFIVMMLLLVAGLMAFLVEVRLSLRATHVRVELLDHQEPA